MQQLCPRVVLLSINHHSLQHTLLSFDALTLEEFTAHCYGLRQAAQRCDTHTLPHAFILNSCTQLQLTSLAGIALEWCGISHESAYPYAD
jgi:hypothetical protein